MEFEIIYIEKKVYNEDIPWYGIYLVNNTDERYQVHYSTWGFYSNDEKTTETKPASKEIWELLPHSRIVLEENDLWQLDIQWYVELILTCPKKEVQIAFHIGKGAPQWVPARLDGFLYDGISMDFWITNIVRNIF